MKRNVNLEKQKLLINNFYKIIIGKEYPFNSSVDEILDSILPFDGEVFYLFYFFR